MSDTSSSIVELTTDVPDHVLVDGGVLCGAPVDRTTVATRVVAADMPVVADASVHRCQECFDRWESVRESVDRVATVSCHCDRFESDVVYRCGAVVPVGRARRLRHPDAPDGVLPVCPDCYEWIRERHGNCVSKPYEEAPAWGDATNPSTADHD